MERKKVAFCYSGCFRNFQDQVEQHLEFSNSLLEKWGIEADIYRFACFWSFNQLTPYWGDGKFERYLEQNGVVDYNEEAHRYPSKVNVPVRAEDVDRVMSNTRCNWAYWKFEPFQTYFDLEEQYPCLHFMRSAHYAMKQVMALRRKYEQQNNLYFDIVVWLRSDKPFETYLEDGEFLPLPERDRLEIFGEVFPVLGEDDCSKDQIKSTYRPVKALRDHIFYGNRHSMDLATECYVTVPLKKLPYYGFTEEHFFCSLLENGISIKHVPLHTTEWTEWQKDYFKLGPDELV